MIISIMFMIVYTDNTITGVNRMNEGKLYDFCLDWQMNQINKKELCKEFINNKWDFTTFKNETIKRSWFNSSMYALLYAEEFSP